jgi:hypothetical protein
MRISSPSSESDEEEVEVEETDRSLRPVLEMSLRPVLETEDVEAEESEELLDVLSLKLEALFGEEEEAFDGFFSSCAILQVRRRNAPRSHTLPPNCALACAETLALIGLQLIISQVVT